MTKKKETRNSKSQLHSFNDEPAVVSGWGSKSWFKDGKLHRDNDEPAVILCDGTMERYKDSKLHRDNGLPAVINTNGSKEWFVNGIQLNNKDVELLKKINASEIKYLPWLLNEDEFFNYLIEKRMNEGNI
jgi:hypothetical protein